MAPERKPDSDRSARRMVYKPGHPLAGKAGYLSAARFALFEKIGPGTHACHWCGTQVTWQIGIRGARSGTLLADHLDRDWRNDDPANLVPACAACNAFRAREERARVADNEPHVVRHDDTRTRAVQRFCNHCGKPFLIPPAALRRPNRGRFCSRSCARQMPR